jgi:hypothetical protein
VSLPSDVEPEILAHGQVKNCGKRRPCSILLRIFTFIIPQVWIIFDYLSQVSPLL